MMMSIAEKYLDAGRLEMQRPWGDYVPIRRKSNTRRFATGYFIPVFMEAQIESNITPKVLAAPGYIRLRK